MTKFFDKFDLTPHELKVEKFILDHYSQIEGENEKLYLDRRCSIREDEYNFFQDNKELIKQMYLDWSNGLRDYRGSYQPCDDETPHVPHVRSHYNTFCYGTLETFCPGVQGGDVQFRVLRIKGGSPSSAAYYLVRLSRATLDKGYKEFLAALDNRGR